MKNLVQSQSLIKETAKFFREAEGRSQMLDTLEKVSAKMEIKPPITLDKMMSVFGTTALMFPLNTDTEKSLEVGRITTADEREKWVDSLAMLDKLVENPHLESLISTAEKRFEINSLELFAEELAIRSRVLLMEFNSVNSLNEIGYPLPNQLKVGELLAAELDKLLIILEAETNLRTKQNKEKPLPDTNQENHRTSRIATESLLKKDFLPVSSSASYQAMREVVALKKFDKDKESPYPTAFVDKSSVKGKIQLTPLKTESVYGEKLKELEFSMWKKHEQLSDLHVDAIDAMCATWIVQATSDESRAVITADDILKLRGLKPHLSGNGRRGGYSMEQREEIVQAVQDLENIWFEITEKTNRGKKSKSDFIQSRAVVVTDRGGQIRLDGSLDVMWFVFRPGSIFARYLLTEGRQSALLAAQALRYNVRTEAVEKRLVRYLSWQWRIRSKTATYLQPYETRTLIKEGGINIPQSKAHRVCERLEKALDRLQTDNLIAGWQYLDWDWSQTSRQGWLKNWMSAKIAIEPPDLIRDSYQSISEIIKTPKVFKINEMPQSDVGISLQTKAKRRAENLTQMQLAEFLGISQPTLSRIEAAKKVSHEEKQNILDWLFESISSDKITE